MKMHFSVLTLRQSTGRQWTRPSPAEVRFQRVSGILLHLLVVLTVMLMGKAPSADPNDGRYDSIKLAEGVRCEHDECYTGAPLYKYCSECAYYVCNEEPSCCAEDGEWGEHCVFTTTLVKGCGSCEYQAKTSLQHGMIAARGVVRESGGKPDPAGTPVWCEYRDATSKQKICKDGVGDCENVKQATLHEFIMAYLYANTTPGVSVYEAHPEINGANEVLFDADTLQVVWATGASLVLRDDEEGDPSWYELKWSTLCRRIPLGGADDLAVASVEEYKRLTGEANRDFGTARSILYRKNDFGVVYSSEYNIGYETGYFVANGKEKLGCTEEEIRERIGEDDGSAYYQAEAFEQCHLNGIDFVWEPIEGAFISTINKWGYVTHNRSNAAGLYSINYGNYEEVMHVDMLSGVGYAASPYSSMDIRRNSGPSNTCVYAPLYNITTKIAFQSFNPRSNASQYFQVTNKASPCVLQKSINFPIDVYMLGGVACMVNEYDLSRELPGEKEYPCVGNVPQDGLEDYIKGRFVQVVNLNVDSSPWLDSTPQGEVNSAELMTTYYSGEDERGDIGLLEKINAADFRDTDIYVFSRSNGELVASRKGLRYSEIGRNFFPVRSDELYEQAFKDLGIADRARARYASMIRGPQQRDAKNAAADSIEMTQTGQMLTRGEKVTVVMINRATGYVGTGVGVVGPDSEPLSIQVEPIVLRPPNLKVDVRRSPQKDGKDFCAAANEEAGDNVYKIGFQGKALVSDSCFVITTTWLDTDGRPLPNNLPGFTGRLAKVGTAVGGNKYDRLHTHRVDGRLIHFPIEPNGPHLQVVHLNPQVVDRGHYYLHVDGDPIQERPNFNSTVGKFDVAGSRQNFTDVYRYRPATYVPFRVAKFDKEETRRVAEQKLYEARQNWIEGDPPPVLTIEKRYSWPYRPEHQFSLLDLEVDQVEIHTTFSDEEGRGSSSVGVDWTYNESDEDPLPKFGEDSGMVFGVGYGVLKEMIDEKEGEDQHVSLHDDFEVRDQGGNEVAVKDLESLVGMGPTESESSRGNPIDDLEAEDYLSLQLYQEDDPGNPLWQVSGLPVLVTNTQPFVLTRNYHQVVFDEGVPLFGKQDDSGGAPYTDTYKIFDFGLTRDADVRVYLLDKDGTPMLTETEESDPLRPIIEQRISIAGKKDTRFGFVLDYETGLEHGLDSDMHREFIVRVEARTIGDDSLAHYVDIKGRLAKERKGMMLGTTIEHDVLIQDGSLNLNRKDLSFPGRGPALEFSRTYSNLRPSTRDDVLGAGWSHNYDQKLVPISDEAEVPEGRAIPTWVADRMGEVFDVSTLPETGHEWTVVGANGTTFRKVSGTWHAERGRRATLMEETVDGVSYLVFRALDGTRYYYAKPGLVKTPDCDFAGAEYIKVDDAVFYALGIEPWELALSAGQNDDDLKGCEYRGSAPSPLEFIEDRNGNRLSLHYEKGRLERVQDASGRELSFHYSDEAEDVEFFGKSVRLQQVTGPGGVGISFVYNEKRETAAGEEEEGTPQPLGYLHGVEREIVFDGTSETWSEQYLYDAEQQVPDGDFNLNAVIDANGKKTQYTYYNADEFEIDGDFYIKDLKAHDVVKQVVYPEYTAEVPEGVICQNTGAAGFQYAFVDGKSTRTVTDLCGFATEYTLNFYGNPIRIKTPTGDGETTETAMEWSVDKSLPGNDLLVRTVAAGTSDERTTRYEYFYTEFADAGYWETVETDPYGNQITTRLDIGFNLPVYRQDRNGKVEQWVYNDWNGDLDEYVSGADKSTLYYYNDDGTLDTEQHPGNTGVTTYKYDDYGNPAGVLGPEGTQTATAFDVMGRLTQKTDPFGNNVHYHYDSLNRLRREVYAPKDSAELVVSGQDTHFVLSKEFTYDLAGNKTSETDLNGMKLTYTYNTRDQVETVTRSVGGEATLGAKTFLYDGNGNLVKETDWKNDPAVSTVHIYDEGNRRRKTTNRLGDSMTMDYDSLGNLIRVQDYAGGVTQHTYDKLDRLSSTTVEGRDGGTINIVYNKEADPKSNLRLLIDQEGHATYYKYTNDYKVAQQVNADLVARSGVDIELLKEQDLLPDDLGLRFKYDDRGNVKEEIDEEGHSTFRTYDQENRLKTVRRKPTVGDELLVAKFEYDPDATGADLVRRFDVKGDRLDTVRDMWGRVSSVVEADGTTEQTWYDGQGSQVQVKDGAGHIKRWKRDVLGRPIAYFDAVAVANSSVDATEKYIAYDANDNLIQKKTKHETLGYITTEFTYDDEERERRITEAVGTPEERYREFVSRDGMGNPKELRELSGIVVKIPEYNALYKPLKHCQSNWGQDGCIEYTYYATGQLEKEIDKRDDGNPGDRVTRYVYDELNRVTRVENPMYNAGRLQINATNTEYDKVGNPILVNDDKGNVTRTTYEPYFYRETKTERQVGTNAWQQLSRRHYDYANKSVEDYDADDRLVAEHFFDARNLPYRTLLKNLDESGSLFDEEEQLRGFDGNGNVLWAKSVTSDGTKQRTFTYDEENRILSETYAGETTSYTYGPTGNMLTIALPASQPGEKFAGKKKEQYYDSLNRLVRVVEQADENTRLVTKYLFDAQDRQVMQRVAAEDDDAALNLGVVEDGDVLDSFDDGNFTRTHTQVRADRKNFVTTYTSYPTGEVKKIEDPMGREFIYRYDALGRRTHADYPLVTSPALAELAREPAYLVESIVTVYDDEKNRVEVDVNKQHTVDGVRENIKDSLIQQFDVFERLDYAVQNGVTVDYDYFPTGMRRFVSTPEGKTNYGYDLRARLKSALAEGESEKAEYKYYRDGRLKEVSYPNGTESVYTYHPTDRVHTIVHRTSGATPSVLLANFTYTYDKNGNRESMVETSGGVSETTSFEYDAINRLREYSVSGDENVTKSYTYEGYNRKTETTVEGGVTTKREYDYDETNRLKQVEVEDPAGNYAIAYSYDSNGNTLSRTDSRLPDAAMHFVFDSRDQLVQTTRGPPTMAESAVLGQYDYNADGQRIRHYQSDRGNVDYLYDGSSVIEERNAADATLLAHYRYADRLMRLDTGTEQQYFHHDAMGSTVALTNASATVIRNYKLDPWGNIRNQTPISTATQTVNRHIFTGKELDANTGLYYYGARYYDPEIGRFLTQDPYLGEAGNPPSLNRYMYAHANPTVFVDPTGYESARQHLASLYEEGEEQGGVSGTGKKVAAVLGYMGWTASNFFSFGALEDSEVAMELQESGQITMEQEAGAYRDANAKAAGAMAVTLLSGGLGRVATGTGQAMMGVGAPQLLAKMTGGVVAGGLGGAVYQGTHDLVGGELSSGGEWAGSVGIGAGAGAAFPLLGAAGRGIAQSRVGQFIKAELQQAKSQLASQAKRVARFTGERTSGAREFARKGFTAGSEALRTSAERVRAGMARLADAKRTGQGGFVRFGRGRQSANIPRMASREYRWELADNFIDTPSVEQMGSIRKAWYRFKHRKLLKQLEQGAVDMPLGSVTAKKMGEITAATNREIGLFRMYDKNGHSGRRVMTIGGPHSVAIPEGTKRVIAHTHPSGKLGLSKNLNSKIDEFGNLIEYYSGDIPALQSRFPKQRSSIVIGPSGQSIRGRIYSK